MFGMSADEGSEPSCRLGIADRPCRALLSKMRGGSHAELRDGARGLGSTRIDHFWIEM